MHPVVAIARLALSKRRPRFESTSMAAQIGQHEQHRPVAVGACHLVGSEVMVWVAVFGLEAHAHRYLQVASVLTNIRVDKATIGGDVSEASACEELVEGHRGSEAANLEVSRRAVRQCPRDACLGASRADLAYEAQPQAARTKLRAHVHPRRRPVAGWDEPAVGARVGRMRHCAHGRVLTVRRAWRRICARAAHTECAVNAKLAHA